MIMKKAMEKQKAMVNIKQIMPSQNGTALFFGKKSLFENFPALHYC